MTLVCGLERESWVSVFGLCIWCTWVEETRGSGLVNLYHAPLVKPFYLFKNIYLRSYHVSGTILGVGDMVANKRPMISTLRTNKIRTICEEGSKQNNVLWVGSVEYVRWNGWRRDAGYILLNHSPPFFMLSSGLADYLECSTSRPSKLWPTAYFCK